MKKFIGKLGLFLSCGFIYCMIEILFRGWSHWSMFVSAGFLGVFCVDSVNNVLSFDCDYIVQILISTILCTIGEGISGIILNVWLQLNVWDYSKMAFGTFFFGQCNIFFCVAWAVLSAVCIVLQDCLVYYVLRADDERPHYHIWNGKILFWLPERK